MRIQLTGLIEFDYMILLKLLINFNIYEFFGGNKIKRFY